MTSQTTKEPQRSHRTPLLLFGLALALVGAGCGAGAAVVADDPPVPDAGLIETDGDDVAVTDEVSGEGVAPLPDLIAEMPLAESGDGDTEIITDGADSVSAHRVSTVEELREFGDVAPGSYQVHLIDVGTGLAILVRGNDFTMLYDGGSRDDKRYGRDARLTAYLWGALGPSGGAACLPNGDDWSTVDLGDDQELVIDHVVLGHPHEDHGNLLGDVLSCYEVRHLWDVGVDPGTQWYGRFGQAVAREHGLVYRTAAEPDPAHTAQFGGTEVQLPSEVTWERFGIGDTEVLGEDASFRVLHVSTSGSNPNHQSIVLRVDLGGTSLLLTGDAESGTRRPPDSPVGGAEAYLLEEHRESLDVDILQVGHHGSMTSSRREFVEAVSPTWALIGCGPYAYGSVVLPDVAVIDMLTELEVEILRTDLDDTNPAMPCAGIDRIGRDDTNPGGCDNWVLVIED